jgi:hypothetical protein
MEGHRFTIDISVNDAVDKAIKMHNAAIYNHSPTIMQAKDQYVGSSMRTRSPIRAEFTAVLFILLVISMSRIGR